MALFNRIFVERKVEDHPNTQKILHRLKRKDYDLIDSVEDIFNQVKKPYLQKRQNLNLFIAAKKGELVKEAPNAYGIANGKHFYFIHAYNCIYECEYCYLQGYFHSPDIVLFVNHDEIIQNIDKIVHAEAPNTVTFHAGEYSDSLALNSITEEYAIYWDYFEKNPNAQLELRTKSVNLSSILNYKALDNIIISLSMSPEKQIQKYDHKTASYKARLEALRKLSDKGFRIGLHFDPIIYDDEFETLYEVLIQDIAQFCDLKLIQHISLGVVRFTKDVFREVQRNYPNSDLLASKFVKSFDNKVRYMRPQRMWILNQVKELCEAKGIASEKIYFCME